MDGCLTPEILKLLVDQKSLLGFESGRLYNTSREIEGKYVQLLEQQSPRAEIKDFAIGPLNLVELESKHQDDRHICLKWLHKQETSSVIYISFGSTTSMQINR